MKLLNLLRRALFNAIDKYINIDDGSADELSGQLGIFTNARLLGFDGSKWQRLRCDEDKHLLTAVEKVKGETSGTITSTSFVDVLTIDISKYRYVSIHVRNKASSENDMVAHCYVRDENYYFYHSVFADTTISVDGYVAKGAIRILGQRLIVSIKSSTGGKVDYYISYTLEK